MNIGPKLSIKETKSYNRIIGENFYHFEYRVGLTYVSVEVSIMHLTKNHWVPVHHFIWERN